MKRKNTMLLSLILVLSMLFSTTAVAAASSGNPGVSTRNLVNIKVEEIPSEMPMPLQTRVISGEEPSTKIGKDGKASGVLSTIGGIVFTLIGGGYATTVYTIILNVAASLGLVLLDDALSRPASAELWHHYIILVKEAQVNDGSGWQTYYTSKSREIYRTEFGQYTDVNNNQRFALFEYVRATGYGPTHTQYAQNYNDSYTLAQIARERFNQYLSPATETWDYTPPRPDPQKIPLVCTR